MKSKNFFVIITIACAAIFGGCKDNTTDPAATNVMVPLKIGNAWTYISASSDTTADASSTNVATESGTVTTTIVKDTTISGSQWFGMTDFFGENSVAYFQNRTDGTWYHEKGRTDMLFKNPATANSTYDGPFGTFTVVSTNESVTVPKGTYSCYHYRSLDGDETGAFGVDFWVAPNVGIVKLEIYSANTDPSDNSKNSSRTTFQLQSTNF